jgi:hypothetical protein
MVHKLNMLATDLNDQGRALEWFRQNGADLQWVMSQMYGTKAIPVRPPVVTIATATELIQVVSRSQINIRS